MLRTYRNIHVLFLQRRVKPLNCPNLSPCAACETFTPQSSRCSARERLPVLKFSPGLFQKAAYPSFRVLAYSSRPRRPPHFVTAQSAGIPVRCSVSSAPISQSASVSRSAATKPYTFAPANSASARICSGARSAEIPAARSEQTMRHSLSTEMPSASSSRSSLYSYSVQKVNSVHPPPT